MSNNVALSLIIIIIIFNYFFSKGPTKWRSISTNLPSRVSGGDTTVRHTFTGTKSRDFINNINNNNNHNNN